jgi:ElaB/YqjD/DUF883 family membrane-anchored ribosome-binding protein
MSTKETLQQSAGDGAVSDRSGARSLAEQSHRVLDEVKGLGDSALATAGDAVHHLREQGAAALENGKQKAGVAKQRFDRVVGENPMKSLLIAMGVGAVVGYALRRR